MLFRLVLGQRGGTGNLVGARGNLVVGGISSPDQHFGTLSVLAVPSLLDELLLKDSGAGVATSFKEQSNLCGKRGCVDPVLGGTSCSSLVSHLLSWCR